MLSMKYPIWLFTWLFIPTAYPQFYEGRQFVDYPRVLSTSVISLSGDTSVMAATIMKEGNFDRYTDLILLNKDGNKISSASLIWPDRKIGRGELIKPNGSVDHFYLASNVYGVGSNYHSFALFKLNSALELLEEHYFPIHNSYFFEFVREMPSGDLLFFGLSFVKDSCSMLLVNKDGDLIKQGGFKSNATFDMMFRDLVYLTPTNQLLITTDASNLIYINADHLSFDSLVFNPRYYYANLIKLSDNSFIGSGPFIKFKPDSWQIADDFGKRERSEIMLFHFNEQMQNTKVRFYNTPDRCETHDFYSINILLASDSSMLLSVSLLLQRR